jgi:hypothetical protein
MKDVATLVSGIDYKLRKLIEQHRIQRDDHQRVLAEIEDLKKVIGMQKIAINNLEEKIKILKITKTIEKKEGAVDAKLKINELVREIDRCIGLLNT